MSEEKKTSGEMANIDVHVGASFDVTLLSQPASTGFAWYLAYLPHGVVLLDSRIDPIAPIMPGSRCRQTFTFLGTAPVEDHISFSLLRPWAPSEPADTLSYRLVVRAAEGLQEDLERTAGRGTFVSPHAYRSHMPPVTPYGFPPPDRNQQPKVFPLYGFPPPVVFGGQPMHTVVESTEHCIVKYGFPWGVSVDPQQCLLKYGFPAGHPHDGRRVIPFSDAGTPVMVKEDPEHCVVKYGTPDGVATDPDNCTEKYGMPAPRE